MPTAWDRNVPVRHVFGYQKAQNLYICLGTCAQRSRLLSPTEMRSEQVACVVTSQNTDGPGAPQSAHGRELGLKTLGERKKQKRHGCVTADEGTCRPGIGQNGTGL